MWEQQPIGVDDSAPFLGHAPGGGKAPCREAAEHFYEHIVRETVHCTPLISWVQAAFVRILFYFI
jgi:hypothetical protein